MPNRATVRVMSASALKPMTQDEFFAWAEKQEARYEFDGFQPVAMTGGTTLADAIGVNVLTALNNRLTDGPCRPLGPNSGVETVNSKIRYPDALITCAPLGPRDKKTPGVIVVFEVVSPTSGGIDRIVKLREYAAVPSIRRYVILESSLAGITVMERSGPDQPWHTTSLTSEDILSIPEVGIEIPVSEIYRRINFTEEESQSG